MTSSGRFGGLLVGAILGVIVLAIYDITEGVVPNSLRPGVSLFGFIIQLVAWVGLMLAVAGFLGWRVIRNDQMVYVLVGFGAIVLTLELFSSVPFTLR